MYGFKLNTRLTLHVLLCLALMGCSASPSDASSVDTLSSDVLESSSDASDTSMEPTGNNSEGPGDADATWTDVTSVDAVLPDPESDGDALSSPSDTTSDDVTDADADGDPATTDDATADDAMDDAVMDDAVMDDAVMDDAVMDDAVMDDAMIDEEPPVSTACDTEVLDFTQSNPQQFEFYELCVEATGASEAELQAIDATLYCGVSGMFAGCKSASEIGCHGDLLYAAPGSKTISDAGWDTLCALSAAEGVRIIAGGYWL